jgi:hypothetical protein
MSITDTPVSYHSSLAQGGMHQTAPQGRYALDARGFESITLENGETAQIPRPSAADLEEPLHVAITGTPEKTTGYMRLIMAGAMARHIFRDLGDTFVGFDNLENLLHRATKAVGLDWLANVIIPIRSEQLDSVYNFFEAAIQENVAPENLSQFNEEGYRKVLGIFRAAGRVEDTHKSIADMYDSFIKTIKEPVCELNIETVKDILGIQGDLPTNRTYEEILNDVIKMDNYRAKEGADMRLAARQQRHTYNTIEDTLNAELKKNQAGHIFDAGLASIITVLTVKYGVDVYKDMHRSFAEAIAYEDKNYDARKKPSEVNLGDIFHSDNKIIQETCDSYVQKNVVRAAACLAFMGRFVSKAFGDEHQWLAHVPFGGLALGGMGVLMLTEVMRKDSSIFNDVIDLIDNKLNPRRGMAANIDGSDLWDLCQKYYLNNDPKKMFQDATHNDQQDGGKWVSARAVCDRMAEMMNHTYKYKNVNISQDDPIAQVDQEIIGRLEYFTLPKFIYLLGHDMIDFNHPATSLACAEIANTYSVQAAKRFWHLVMDEGVSLHDALGDYVVDLSKTLGHGDSEIDAISARAPLYRKAMIENFLEKNPDIKEKYSALLDVKEAMEQQGRTSELRQSAETLQKEIRILMNESQARANIEGDIESPNTAVNNVVPYKRVIMNPELAHSII